MKFSISTYRTFRNFGNLFVFDKTEKQLQMTTAPKYTFTKEQRAHMTYDGVRAPVIDWKGEDRKYCSGIWIYGEDRNKKALEILEGKKTFKKDCYSPWDKYNGEEAIWVTEVPLCAAKDMMTELRTLCDAGTSDFVFMCCKADMINVGNQLTVMTSSWNPTEWLRAQARTKEDFVYEEERFKARWTPIQAGPEENWKVKLEQDEKSVNKDTWNLWQHARNICCFHPRGQFNPECAKKHMESQWEDCKQSCSCTRCLEYNCKTHLHTECKPDCTGRTRKVTYKTERKRIQARLEEREDRACAQTLDIMTYTTALLGEKMNAQHIETLCGMVHYLTLIESEEKHLIEERCNLKRRYNEY